MNPDSITYYSCRICGSKESDLFRKSGLTGPLTSDHFKITDYQYGVTGELRKCRQCGFIQCTDPDKVLPFYEEMEDPDYEKGRDYRLLQESRVLRFLKKIKPEGSLLDVGAGSGMLVEAAARMGYDAEGIEPSKWLHAAAQKHGLPVHLGTFPHPATPGLYDIITLVDVLEHVTDPLDLMTDLRRGLNKDGLLALVTPDVRSLPARIFKKRWWHYRVAHRGYFSRNSLAVLAGKAGLELLTLKRPAWYFSAGYLAVRALEYLPRFLRFRPPGWLDRITVPVNLGDSILAIYQPASDD